MRFRQIQRYGILPLLVAGLGVYYLMVYAPLVRKAEALEAPLQKAWRNLTVSLDQTNSNAIDFPHITNQLAETRQALHLLEDAKQKTAARLELGPVLRAKMNAPFQLVDYENERSKQMDDIARLAKQQQVSVDPQVFASFPEHTVDIKQPSLLWPSLGFVNTVLTAALRAKVAVIHSLEVPPPALTNAPAADDPPLLTEISLRLELTGSSESVATLLQSLPLRADEIKTAGLPEAPLEKAPLFLDRLVIKKQSPDKPDELRVALRAVGFVLRD